MGAAEDEGCGCGVEAGKFEATMQGEAQVFCRQAGGVDGFERVGTLDFDAAAAPRGLATCT